jgi:xylulose-5-phosphate/fructose-6-phosphate phosphoketolase
VVGDREAETGPLATAWHSNKFLNPKTDGTVLPILHLDGCKIANPTVFARIPRSELQKFLEGCGWMPFFVAGSDPAGMHRLMAATLEEVLMRIRKIRQDARVNGAQIRPTRPMIVLESPKAGRGRRRSGQAGPGHLSSPSGTAPGGAHQPNPAGST